jgi:hypothetical protein
VAIATKKPPTDQSSCGTPAGYRVHYRSGERACDPCRVAHNADRRRSQIVYDAAIKRLREAHPEEFRQLVAEERQELAGDAR